MPGSCGQALCTAAYSCEAPSRFTGAWLRPLFFPHVGLARGLFGLYALSAASCGASGGSATIRRGINRRSASACPVAPARSACGVPVVAVIGTVLLIVNVAFGVGWISDAWPFACFRRLIFRSVRDVIG
jgi:hypothetical protein